MASRIENKILIEGHTATSVIHVSLIDSPELCKRGKWRGNKMPIYFRVADAHTHLLECPVYFICSLPLRLSTMADELGPLTTMITEHPRECFGATGRVEFIKERQLLNGEFRAWVIFTHSGGGIAENKSCFVIFFSQSIVLPRPSLLHWGLFSISHRRRRSEPKYFLFYWPTFAYP